MTTITTRRFLQTTGLLFAGVLLAACGKKEPAPAPAASAAAPAASVAAAPAPAKVYVVGTDAAYAPFESQNEKGEIVGFDIDVLKAVAKPRPASRSSSSTRPGKASSTRWQGDRDMLVSAVTITDERKQTMDFSQPLLRRAAAHRRAPGQQGGEVRRPEEAQGRRADRHHRRRGVTKLLGKTSTNDQALRVTPLALKELEAGGVDAVVADNGVVIHYVANNPGGKFKTVSDKELRARAVRLRREEGQHRTAGQAEQGPGRSRPTAATTRSTPSTSAPPAGRPRRPQPAPAASK
jgi:polar amino acid transport system substrate-binding protein